MIVPQLVDFADEVFTDNHCFRYAGVSTVDGVRRIQVDFEPIKTLREPDVRGSMYLDTASYQLVRTDFVMERPSYLHPTEETLEIRRQHVVPRGAARAARSRPDLHANCRSHTRSLRWPARGSGGDAAPHRSSFRTRAGRRRGPLR